MSRSIEFSPFVFTDLDEIWDYISFHNVDAARQLIRNISSKFDILSQSPLIGTARDDLITGLRLFPYNNYNIFYFPTDRGVEIYRVLHGSRDTIQIFDDTIDGS